jgi:hypothetical protein
VSCRSRRDAGTSQNDCGFGPSLVLHSKGQNSANNQEDHVISANNKLALTHPSLPFSLFAGALPQMRLKP